MIAPWACFSHPNLFSLLCQTIIYYFLMFFICFYSFWYISTKCVLQINTLRLNIKNYVSYKRAQQKLFYFMFCLRLNFHIDPPGSSSTQNRRICSTDYYSKYKHPQWPFICDMYLSWPRVKLENRSFLQFSLRYCRGYSISN